MKVISNTTPFIALASIDRLELLQKLFGRNRWRIATAAEDTGYIVTA